MARQDNMEEASCVLGGTEYRIAPIGRDDRASVERLFVEVFGDTPPEGWWSWKYGQEGLGGQASGLWSPEGQLIAHYAGFPRVLEWQGASMSAIQIGDVMVAPKARGLLTRRGPFFQVCSRFFDHWVGEGRAFELAFGFPNERAQKLGRTLSLYHDLGVLDQLSWAAVDGPLPWLWHAVPLDVDTVGFDRAADEAWVAMAADMTGHVLGVRDASYLRARFGRRPAARYRMYALRRRFGRQVHAVLVLRFDAAGAEWLDFIGSRAMLPLAARVAGILTARAGASRLFALASRAVSDALAASGADITPSAAHFAIARLSTPDADALARARWWWMGGDTDFL